MARYFTCLFLALLLALAGCAGNKYDKNTDMKANLEPEVWDTGQILKDLKRGRPLTEQEKRALASRGAIQFNLDVADNEEVQMFLQYFTVDRKGTMTKWLQRSEPYLPYVRAVLASYNLPPDLIVLPFIESGYSPMAYSPVGAGGMWQFMPYTARRFGLTVNWWVDERRDPYKSTVAAAKYLTKLYQMFGDWNLALAAYNAGEGKISRVVAASGQCDFFDIAKDPKLLKEETRHYVPKFLAVLKIFQNLDSLGFKKINWQAGPNLKEVPVPGGTDLLALAKVCNLSWEQFRDYNPGFRRQVSPPEATVNVYVPVAKEQTVLAFLQHPDNYPSGGVQSVTAQAGDTWWAIARRAGMPVAELRQLNASLPEDLPPGQTVRVALSASGLDNATLAEGPAACAPKAVATAKPLRHRVNRGETIGSIARKYGVSTSDLMAANKMKTPRRLSQGSWIVIPGAAAQPTAVAAAGKSSPSPAAPAPKQEALAESKHHVQRGESLSGIAARYGVSVETLMAANKLRSPNDLRAGATLDIPGKLPAKVEVASIPVKPAPTAKDSKESRQAKETASSKPATTPPAAKQTAEHFSAPTANRLFAANTPPAKTPAAAPAKGAAPTAKAPAKSNAPAKAVNYKVGPGETVWGIAKKFNVEPSSLMAWNNMKSPGALQAGSQITIRKE